MIRVRPLAFKPVGSHAHTATGGGWLYVVASEIDAQRRHIEAVRALLDTPVE